MAPPLRLQIPHAPAVTACLLPLGLLAASCSTSTISGTQPSRVGAVSDLAVTGVTPTAVTLRFTEVSDGAGGVVSYDVRYAATTIDWTAATPVSQGTCTTPVAGLGAGNVRNCTVEGLSPGTLYAFQLAAFRGTLGLDALYGPASNVASQTTLAAPDTTPPTVVSTSPTDQAASVSVASSVTATFSEAIAASSATTSSFTLDQGATGMVTTNGSTVTFTPASALTTGTTYTATLGTAITDVAGNHLAVAYSWSFTTSTSVPVSFPYDFYISPSGGSGAGTLGDPWSLPYALQTGAGTAQGDGKLPADNQGINIGVLGGTYTVKNFTATLQGSLKTGADNWNPSTQRAPGKIILRNYNGQRAAIYQAQPVEDDWIVSTQHVWFWGLEFYRDWPDRVTGIHAGTAVWIYQVQGGVKFIHCWVHDGDDGFYISTEDKVSSHGRVEVYGNVIFNSGWDMVVPPGDGGHGFYAKHKGLSPRMSLEENILGSTFALNTQVYNWDANGPPIEGVDYIGNIHYNAGCYSGSNWPRDINSLVLGGEYGGNDVVAEENEFYQPDGHGDVHIVVGWATSSDNVNFHVQRNYAIGGGSGWGAFWVKGRQNPPSGLVVHDNVFAPDLSGGNQRALFTPEANPLGYDWANNTWYRDPTTASYRDTGGDKTWTAWKTATGLGATDTAQTARPTTTRVLLRPTARYEPKRGHIVYYNWANLGSIPLPASELARVLVAGDHYAIYDCRDPAGVIGAPGSGSPVVSGVWDGASAVSLPTTQLADPPPIGGATNPAPATAPFFNAFVLRGW